MCTATWIRGDDGHELLFNRDERRTRAEAEPPRLHFAPGAERGEGPRRWLAPVDGEFGGTWISVNEAGLTLALLNGRPASDDDPDDPRSRGLLVADLASAFSLEEVEARLDAAPLARTRAFRLLALAPGRPVHLVEWDRERLAIDRDADARRPMISSPIEETEVAAARRDAYARVVPQPTLDALLAFHRDTGDGAPSARTVAMRRPEAATRSFTHVTVTADDVVMRYAAGLPRADAPETRRRLPRLVAPRALDLAADS